MAKPRVFISSTYYDLKHVRSSLDSFIDSLGFESVLFEKGDIAYSPDAPLDESCYREAAAADIFVMIVGGRYGSVASGEEQERDPEFFDQYNSVSKKELESALAEDVPVYILVDSGVYGEYRTFQRNRSNTDINYAHVDSVNVFHLLDEILGLRQNNPVAPFERASDIETWLREQWAGLFKEYLSQRSGRRQLVSLSARVEELGEVNRTLRRYIEEIITRLSPDDSAAIIDEEQKRLSDVKKAAELKSNDFLSYIHEKGIPLEDIQRLLIDAKTFRGFLTSLTELGPEYEKGTSDFDYSSESALRLTNEARAQLGLDNLRKR